MGRLATQSTGGWSSYEEHTATLAEPVSGLKTLYVQADGGSAVANIDWVRFERDGGGASECVEPGTWFRLRNRQNDRYAYGAGGADSDGDRVRLRPIEDWLSMQWRLVDNGDGWYRLENRASNTFAYGADNADSNGDLLKLRTVYEGWRSMQWRFERAGGDWHRLQNRDHELYAWGADQSASTNTDVKLRRAETWRSLQWTCEPVSEAFMRTGLEVSSSMRMAPGPYPNPSSDRVRIVALGEEPQEIRVRVYDVLGRIVLSERATPSALDGGWAVDVRVSTLAPGLYLYEVVGGGKTTSGRLTVAR